MQFLKKTRSFAEGVVKSYSQVFFADNISFAIILLLVSFIDPGTGLAGLISVITTNLTARQLGFNKAEIENGLFGFNSLLVGLGIGYFFSPGLETYLIVIAGSVLTLLFVTFFKGVLYKYGLPYLSLPFLFGIWTIMIASSSFESLGISQKGIYTLNTLYGIGGAKLVEIYEWISNIQLNESLKIYFNSVGAIFFQFNALSGAIIATGLLLFSRIAFLLSLYGFYIAYYFYTLLGGNLAELSYTYIGFNYILTAIAIGGFYLIPSRKTFLWLLLLIPLVTLVTISLSKVFLVFRLSVYSLPFNIVVLLFIYALKFRTRPSRELNEVFIQQNKPERNLYSYHNQKIKAYHRNLTPFQLPFYGTWTVTQGHEGEYTHKEGWRHAFDFVITDEENKQFKNEGFYPTDYYCFGKSVLAPAEGTIAEVIDTIKDNEIGKANMIDNWGNTVVIKHGDYLYSALSHLKEKSVTVKPGDKVKKGQKIGEAGNSGRSPYPHLHMQFQETPWIGSETLDYPVSYYIVKKNGTFKLETFSKPEKDERLSNIECMHFLKNKFDFIPGKILRIEYSRGEDQDNLEWEIFTNPFNQSYIFEEKTKSYAWFVNDGCMMNFTGFHGDKTSVLFSFYLGFYKFFYAWYKDISIKDEIPQNDTFRFPLLSLQDFIAPFYLFLKSGYENKILSIDNELQPGQMEFSSRIERKVFGKTLSVQEFSINITKEAIDYRVNLKGNELKVKIF
jgi:urea transporter